MDLDPFSEPCPSCNAGVGCSCVYLHPSRWSNPEQFNKMPGYAKQEAMMRVGQPLKSGKPHRSRLRASHKVHQSQLELNYSTEAQTVFRFTDEDLMVAYRIGFLAGKMVNETY